MAFINLPKRNGVKRRTTSLGAFDDEEAAARAYDKCVRHNTHVDQAVRISQRLNRSG
jgi:hypothetical protein